MDSDASCDLSGILSAYLSGEKSLRDFSEWLAGIDWDDVGFDSQSRSDVGKFELLSVDSLEGFRSEDEFRRKALDFVSTKFGG